MTAANEWRQKKGLQKTKWVEKATLGKGPFAKH